MGKYRKDKTIDFMFQERLGLLMITRRMKISIITGMLLGVVCIVGASIRSGFERELYWLFALWYNRLIMGILIGASWNRVSLNKSLLRGAGFGLLVSFAFYATSGFQDPVSFMAGIVYGVIIEYMAHRLGNIGDNSEV